MIDESKPPQFVIVVHMAEQEHGHNEEKPEQITTGWVLLRTLNEFQVINMYICQTQMETKRANYCLNFELCKLIIFTKLLTST